VCLHVHNIILRVRARDGKVRKSFILCPYYVYSTTAAVGFELCVLSFDRPFRRTPEGYNTIRTEFPERGARVPATTGVGA